MAKLKLPFFSFDALGRFGKHIRLLQRLGGTIAEVKPETPNVQSQAQLSWRHMFQKVVALWHALPAEERQVWESLARPRHMTGYAWFVSQALRPNPGLYLPLQGGSMQGDIDMAKHFITSLPLPTDPQHPATKGYVDALTKVIWKDASANALADMNRTVTLDWTDLDLTAHTSSDAKLAILLLRFRADVLGLDDCLLRLRKNGTTPAANSFMILDAAGTTTGVFHHEFVIIGLDTSQVIEYSIAVGPGGWQIDTIIDVLGYIE